MITFTRFDFSWNGGSLAIAEAENILSPFPYHDIEAG
jgi:hypothetical protein